MNRFTNIITTINESLLSPSKTVTQQFRDQYNGKAYLDFSTLDPNTVELSNIDVDKEHRGKGHASTALTLLTNLADTHNVTIGLEVGGDDAGIDGSIEELLEFYSRHGFKWEDGYMARYPQ